MPSSALGFVAGTCLMLLLPQLPSAGALAGLAVAALVVGWRAGSFVPIALVAGVILGRAEALSRMADQLDPAVLSDVSRTHDREPGRASNGSWAR